MKRRLSVGRSFAINDWAEDCVTPVTYRVRMETTAVGVTIVEAEPRIPPPRWDAVQEKLRERLAFEGEQ